LVGGHAVIERGRAAAASRAASTSSVTIPDTKAMIRGAGRPARSAAAVTSGTMCSPSVPGPAKRAPALSLVSYWRPARMDVMRCVLKPSQCIRPT
jgi:hypothetical protein